ncbi:DUF998 domain-containing protein [Methanosphaerula palustris]|uniref:DUF998 domain-containing protein n=1 Tax=Methanosphaerula palustris (strain ATCC BAA-1556 / DSM 19958 / E1-9c) TaxID=521011 RepID=B8GH43_METPE|nr:DUF998 domain-containing protein [Methanosphaerula palustris]ACL16448.1 hypothetical protein Mpal_1102 [Methanosphaerula palustris E1-9c]
MMAEKEVVEMSNSGKENNKLALQEREPEITMTRTMVAALAGMAGSMLFAGAFTIEGWFHPGYNPLSMYVSVLSLGPSGWIQMGNFVISGSLLLIFAWGIAPEFPTGKASKTGALLLGIIAVCLLFSGPFVMDPMGTLRGTESLHGMVHGLLGGIVFICMAVSCFVFLRCFREDPKWQWFRGPTLAAGAIIAASVILLTLVTKLPLAPEIFEPWLGLIQRGIIIPFMIWLFVFALGLYRQKRVETAGRNRKVSGNGMNR